MKGWELYQYLIELSGLEPADIQPVIDKLLKRCNLSIESLTEDNVRQVMMLYLEELNQIFSIDDSIFPGPGSMGTPQA